MNHFYALVTPLVHTFVASIATNARLATVPGFGVPEPENPFRPGGNIG